MGLQQFNDNSEVAHFLGNPVWYQTLFCITTAVCMYVYFHFMQQNTVHLLFNKQNAKRNFKHSQ